MLKRIVFFIGVPVLLGWILASPSLATKEIAKTEKKGCITCHVKANEKELNDAGKYYMEHKTLEGYKK
jgi:hypothetical protein